MLDLIAELGRAFIILSCHCQGKLLFQITDGMGFRFALFRPFGRFSVMVGIRLNLVEEVAAVETQAGMSPSPQTACPVTYAPVMFDVMMKIPQMTVMAAKA